jgi:cytidylate kinase
MSTPKRLTIYLKADAWEKLQRLSDYFGLSVSQMAASMTKRSFQKHKRSIEIVEQYAPDKKGEAGWENSPETREVETSAS